MEDFLGLQNLQGEQISKDYYIVVTYVKTRMERWGLRNVDSQWGGVWGFVIRILKNLKGDQVNFIVTTKILQTLFPSPPPPTKKKKTKKKNRPGDK